MQNSWNEDCTFSLTEEEESKEKVPGARGVDSKMVRPGKK